MTPEPAKRGFEKKYYRYSNPQEGESCPERAGIGGFGNPPQVGNLPHIN
jgi:hypothetical protein